MIETLKALCALSGVSGSEDEVRDYIAARVKEYGCAASTDVMGNVTVLKKGARAPAKKIVFCSHIDEVGVIVTGITEEGCLRFSVVGSVDARVIFGKTVAIGKNHLPGVIGSKAIHLVKAKDRETALGPEDLYIDIGAKGREAAEKLVALGDTGTFDNEIREFGDGFIRAKAIDDRVGCAVLLEMIGSDLPVDCTFAFTAQEEVGSRGAYTAAFREAPGTAVIIEGTSAADLPSVPEHKKVCRVGGGAVVPFMDRGTIYDRELREALTALADKRGIKWQTKNVVAGATDGAAFQRSRAGIRTLGLAAPIRNLHSPSCVGKRSDIEEVYKLARLFLEEMG